MEAGPSGKISIWDAHNIKWCVFAGLELVFYHMFIIDADI